MARQGRRLERERVPAPQLRETRVPSSAGVYCWWEGEEPLFVAAADDLRHQLVEVETGGPQRYVPPLRQFARARAQRAGRLGYGEDKKKIIAAVNKTISSWTVSWVKTNSMARAEALAQEARADLLGEGEPWRPRPGEDRWLRRYLDDLGTMGRVYVEVPVGKQSGGTARRIDAVRFPQLDDDVRSYQFRRFGRDVNDSCEIELIEVKRTLNRPVIGQLLVARDLAVREWDLEVSCHLTLVAMVTSSDRALEDFCLRNGIRVELVDRVDGDMDPEGY